MISRKIIVLFLGSVATFASAARAQDLNDQLEEAMKKAVQKAAPSVVQIITEGGGDVVVTPAKGATFRKSMGPTTGIIVGADGYIITSAFNFLNNPTGILVSVPGQDKPFTATKVATDRNRMLTLIKIDKTGLPVPAAVPVKDIREGQWAVALGRTLNTKIDSPPSVSIGVISALGRIWGKAIQTDAKISPVNYGGPIIDIQGRVQGILIPANPRVKDDGSVDEAAGFEWYDSGVGFAIPFEDVLAVFPRLKEGKDLRPVNLRGLLGPLDGGDGGDGGDGPSIESSAVIKQVVKDSGPAKAGLKSGDIIIEADGQPVHRLVHFRQIIGRRYDGDKISIKVKRGKETLEFKDVDLSVSARSVAHSFLGILPMRDDPRLGVEIRYVYPNSPAANAGLKEGDRIVKFGTGKNLGAFTGPKYAREQLMDFLNSLPPAEEIQLEVMRKTGKTDVVSVKLDSLTKDYPIPDNLDKSSLERAREPLEVAGKPIKADPEKRKGEKGLMKRMTPDRRYWLFVPATYDSNVSHALFVYLHPPGKNEDRDFDEVATAWTNFCEKKSMILLMPVSDNENGWVPGDADSIAQAVRDTLKAYTIDRQRIVAHGLGVSGQMALHLGFGYRDLFRGVAAAGAVTTNPRDNVKDLRLAFYMVGGELDPLIDHIGKNAARLAEMNYPATFRRIAARGRQPLEQPQMRELVNWIDTLDKM